MPNGSCGSSICWKTWTTCRTSTPTSTSRTASWNWSRRSKTARAWRWPRLGKPAPEALGAMPRELDGYRLTDDSLARRQAEQVGLEQIDLGSAELILVEDHRRERGLGDLEAHQVGGRIGYRRDGAGGEDLFGGYAQEFRRQHRHRCRGSSELIQQCHRRGWGEGWRARDDRDRITREMIKARRLWCRLVGRPRQALPRRQTEQVRLPGSQPRLAELVGHAHNMCRLGRCRDLEAGQVGSGVGNGKSPRRHDLLHRIAVLGQGANRRLEPIGRELVDQGDPCRGGEAGRNGAGLVAQEVIKSSGLRARGRRHGGDRNGRAQHTDGAGDCEAPKARRALTQTEHITTPFSVPVRTG